MDSTGLSEAPQAIGSEGAAGWPTGPNGLHSGYQHGCSILPKTYVALDIETTGLDPEEDRITEVGAVRFSGDGSFLDEYSTLVDPGRPIPRFITTLTGISDEMVAGAPAIEDVADEIAEFIGEGPLVGQNIGFDISYLRREGVAVRVPSLDTSRFARILRPGERMGGLAGLARHYGVTQDDAHRGLVDAKTAAAVYIALLAESHTLPAEQRRQLSHLVAIEEPLLAEEIARGMPSDDSGALPFSLPKARETPPALEPKEDGTPITEREVAHIFESGVAAREGFERRTEQLDMAAAVTQAFAGGGHWLAEAGTGVGKTLAYLVPAALHALRHNTRVVVSTNTINLQEQILTKDVPALREMLRAAGVTSSETELRVSVLKGRANYLCTQRWATACAAEAGDADFARFASSLLLWVPETKTGDRSELSLGQDDFQTWQRLSAGDADCLSRQHAYVRDGRCFLHRARREAEAAHIVIVNHALLLADVVTGRSAIPPFEHLIIDEAHNLEEQATRQFGKIVSRRGIAEALDGLARPGRDRKTGGIAALLESLRDESVSSYAADLRADVERAQKAATDPFELLAEFREEHADDDRALVTMGLRRSEQWEAFEAAVGKLDEALRKAIDRSIAAARIIAAGAVKGEEGQTLAGQVETAAARVEEHRINLADLASHGDDEQIVWASKERDGATALNSAPRHVGPDLWDQLFEQCETVIATSATLSTGTDLSFTAGRIGLDEAEELQVGSPFDYETNALIALPTDVSEPNERDHDITAARAVEALSKATGGRALALFTSHQSLRRAAELCRPGLEEAGIGVMVQGADGSPRQLIDNLVANSKAVIFGTSSFWEGVDIPGDALSLLLIDRLPFGVPSDPIHKARSEQYDRAFDQYSLPGAILKFRQGFGRLIRTKTDRGIVAVLDGRITSKRYGQQFLRAVPTCTVLRDTSQTLADEARRWLAQ